MLSKQPDFLIIGAMKSGTTSLHAILDAHPDVYMPQGEVQLFTIDDIEQNPVFFPFIHDAWVYQSFDTFFDEYAAWHARLYQGAPADALLGEDAPSYLPSRQAIDRISTYASKAKLLVILRDPVERLYSHYWHWVRSYRAIYSLEDTIRFQHGNLLQRSYYEEQLRYCLGRVPREQIHVVIFESFVREQRRVVEDVYAFLGLDPTLTTSLDEQHANPSRYPRHPRLALWRNRLLRELYGRQYYGQIPHIPESSNISLPKRIFLRLHRAVNPYVEQQNSMRKETRQLLTALLRERNAGLPDLLDIDLAAYWPTFRPFPY